MGVSYESTVPSYGFPMFASKMCIDRSVIVSDRKVSFSGKTAAGLRHSGKLTPPTSLHQFILIATLVTVAVHICPLTKTAPVLMCPDFLVTDCEATMEQQSLVEKAGNFPSSP